MQTIKGEGFVVTIVKSHRRKSSALKIKQGQVSLHIPYHLPMHYARTFISTKTPWILKKLSEVAQQPPLERQFINGEQLYFLGQQYCLQLLQAAHSPLVNKSAQTICLSGRLNRLSKNTLRRSLIDWYQQQATQYFNLRTAELAHITNLHPQSITVKSYKARWGSCGIKGDIQFNWKLILAPPDIIDYVIIHELCHLQHHNHSASFWQLVERHSPTFKQAKHWLKHNAYHLEI